MESVVSLSFVFPRSPEDNKKQKQNKKKMLLPLHSHRTEQQRYLKIFSTILLPAGSKDESHQSSHGPWFLCRCLFHGCLLAQILLLGKGRAMYEFVYVEGRKKDKLSLLSSLRFCGYAQQ